MQGPYILVLEVSRDDVTVLFPREVVDVLLLLGLTIGLALAEAGEAGEADEVIACAVVRLVVEVAVAEDMAEVVEVSVVDAGRASEVVAAVETAVGRSVLEVIAMSVVGTIDVACRRCSMAFAFSFAIRSRFCRPR